VKPEYLMEPKDYKHWKWLQEVEDASGDVDAAIQKRTVPNEDKAMLADAIFEAISKRAWADGLLQVSYLFYFSGHMMLYVNFVLDEKLRDLKFYLIFHGLHK